MDNVKIVFRVLYFWYKGESKGNGIYGEYLSYCCYFTIDNAKYLEIFGNAVIIFLRVQYFTFFETINKCKTVLNF